MLEVKEVREQIRSYTILAARVGSDEWGYVTVKGEDGRLYVRAQGEATWSFDRGRHRPRDRSGTRPQGRRVGTATPYDNGSVRYYDARGKTLGTSTTTGNTTSFYDAGGRPTGSATSPGSLAFPRR